jgi:Astacin (Peptidase family M12A)
MMLTPNQYQFLFSNDSLKRHGLERSFSHWKDASVPYKIDISIDAVFKKIIFEAMEYISGVSCVKFRDADSKDKDYVLVTSGPGCSSAVGNIRRGEQTIRLSNQCEKGNIIHEFLHTLGFLHMHVSGTKTCKRQSVLLNFISRQLHREMITSK